MVREPATIVFLVALLVFALGPSSTHAEASVDEPVFVYSFTGNPDLDDVVDRSGTMADGVLVSILLDLGERANRPDVAALQAALGELSQRERFENTIGCVFVDPGEACQPIVFLTENPLKTRSGVEELFARFDEYSVTSAWLVYVIEQAHQGGYNLSLTARRLSRAGDDVEESRQAIVMYRDLFSKGSDAHARGLAINDRSASPKIGSKDARALYWISGEPPRIEALVRESPRGAADMLRYLLNMTDGKSYKEFKATANELPKASDADLYNGEKCRARAGMCNMRVVDRTEDRVRVLWAPGGDMPYMMSFNIPGLH